ncbi:MAG: PilZ domain-containing protein [Colwellia sp.]|jgi:c-di-GMP-binding flagellar brake protein YcgR|uniref:PilZ domain-containing protein n=1 Tax=Colwellia sp. Bg11-12 TaxID=2759817 RepID=UPI0015F6E49E|nr:PilZ domain-containing protein [Colwellia sp. Bg11-12]MBA6263433.1 PilZ domain-containing protein [Colwellia sp. Bg11-12]
MNESELDPSSVDDSERRQAFRLDMEKELVDILWINDQQKSVQRKITCLDFSRGGLKLDCDHIIPLHTKVTVVFKVANPNSQNLYGTVIRCIEQPNGYFELALRLENQTAK